jgi:FAD:protein FMN transferase
MGTVVSVDVRGPASSAAEAVDDVLAWLHDVDARFSTYREGSEISRLDRGELALADATGDVRWVLDRCAALRHQTGGFFDERAGGRLDPSALAKGWAVPRGADLLSTGGVTDFCLSAGGDLVTRGAPAPGRRWRTGIQHPHDRDAIAAVVEGNDLAVANSGAYERGAHILDPAATSRPGASCR